MSKDRLERENGYVLDAVQAMLGLIAPSVEAISLRVTAGELRFYFWTHGDVAEIKEDAAEIASERWLRSCFRTIP